MKKIIAVSKNRHRATATEFREHGGRTVTEFYVFRDEDENKPSLWKVVSGYGRTPGDRKMDAISRSGLAEDRHHPIIGTCEGPLTAPRDHWALCEQIPSLNIYRRGDYSVGSSDFSPRSSLSCSLPPRRWSLWRNVQWMADFDTRDEAMAFADGFSGSISR